METLKIILSLLAPFGDEFFKRYVNHKNQFTEVIKETKKRYDWQGAPDQYFEHIKEKSIEVLCGLNPLKAKEEVSKQIILAMHEQKNSLKFKGVQPFSTQSPPGVFKAWY